MSHNRARHPHGQQHDVGRQKRARAAALLARRARRGTHPDTLARELVRRGLATLAIVESGKERERATRTEVDQW